MDPLPPDDGPLVSFAVEGEHLVVTAPDGWALPLGLEVAEATRRLERFSKLCSTQPPHPTDRQSPGPRSNRSRGPFPLQEEPMPTLPIIRQCTVPVLAVEDNLAAHAIGDEVVVVMCEVADATDHLIAGGSVQAVGYDRRGGIVAMAEASELVFWPHQSRAVQLALRALDAPIATVCVFTACKAEERSLEYEESGAA